MTGWRISQALALSRDAVNLTTGTATAFSPAEDTKGKRDVLVPLHKLAVEYLKPITGPGGLMFPWPYDRRILDHEFDRIQVTAGIGQRVKEKGKRARFKGTYGFHDFRRAFATMNQELPPVVLQHLMQHKSFQTTQGYISHAKQLKPNELQLYAPPIPSPAPTELT